MKRRKTTWIMIGLGVLVVLIGAGFAREIARSHQIDREITALRDEAESLRTRNFEIASLTRSLNDEDFLEREARLKLGLRKEGESVVVLRRSEHGTMVAERAGEGSQATQEWSNPNKWWKYFSDRTAYNDYAVRHGFK